MRGSCIRAAPSERRCFHPPDKLARQAVAIGRNPGQPDDPLAPLDQARAREPVHAREKVQVLEYGQVFVQRKSLRDVADTLAHGVGVAGHVDAVDERVPRRGAKQSAQNADQRRLARPVGPQQAEDGPARDGETDLAQRPHRAVVVGDRAHLDAEAIVGRCYRAIVGVRVHSEGCSSKRTVAVMPALSSGDGATSSLTANTWSSRCSAVCTLRGVYSARELIEMTRAAKRALRERVDEDVGRLPNTNQPQPRLGHEHAHPQLAGLQHGDRHPGWAPRCRRVAGRSSARCRASASAPRSRRTDVAGTRGRCSPRRTRRELGARLRCDCPRAALRRFGRRSGRSRPRRRRPRRRSTIARGATPGACAPSRRDPTRCGRARSLRGADRSRRGRGWPWLARRVLPAHGFGPPADRRRDARELGWPRPSPLLPPEPRRRARPPTSPHARRALRWFRNRRIRRRVRRAARATRRYRQREVVEE